MAFKKTRRMCHKRRFTICAVLILAVLIYLICNRAKMKEYRVTVLGTDYDQTTQQTGHKRVIPYENNEVLITKYEKTRQPRGDNRGFQRVTSDGSFYAYSAYYDPRDEPQLRIFVMCTQVYMNITYTCKVQMKTGEIHHVPGAFSIFMTYLPYVYKYVSGVVKCQLSSCCEDWSQLDSVSLYPSKKDLNKYQHNFTTRLNKLTIVKHKFNIILPGPKKNKFTRCIAPLHSKYRRANKLIWNIEISRLSGADKFIFYNHSISTEVDRILRHYVKEGTVEVRVWNIPKKRRFQVYYYAQMIAEHDCLMSQMFAAKYVLLADLDEIILPKSGLSVVKMADKVFDYDGDTPKTVYGSLVFECLSFIKSYINESILDSYPELLEARHLQIEPLLFTTYFEPMFDSRKALVIPERVDISCVHNTCSMQRGFKEKRIYSRGSAVLLHYRKKPRHMRDTTTFNEFANMLEYRKEIVAAISKRYKRLNILRQ